MEIEERCNTIEECYEFMLAYAAQGLPSDQGSHSRGQIRGFLDRAVNALNGLAESYATAVRNEASMSRRTSRRSPGIPSWSSAPARNSCSISR